MTDSAIFLKKGVHVVHVVSAMHWCLQQRCHQKNLLKVHGSTLRMNVCPGETRKDDG